MTKKDQKLIQLTKEFTINFHPEKINESLIELYFSFTSITSDFSLQFQYIASNIHSLIKFITQLKKQNEELEDIQETRRRKKKVL